MKYRYIIFCAVLAMLPLIASAQGSSLGLHTVVIDPGHGGKDPGCVSRDGRTQEKALTLDISQRLQKKIEAAYKDVDVYLTRKDNSTFVALSDRAKFATRKNADFFISVHINASKSRTPYGFSVHLLGPSADKNKDTYAFNMDVCKRENEVIFLEEDYSTKYEGFDPSNPESDIFLHLMQTAYREQSLLFGQLVEQKMSARGPFRKSMGIMQNNFAVLRLATMPAVLLEMGFISNDQDLATLRSSANVEKIAQQLFEAFCDYKKLYDESVGAKSSTPDKEAAKAVTAVAPEPEKEIVEEKPVEQKNVEPEVQGSVQYGTQVLATSRKMSDNDKYFLGYKPTAIWTGKLYKYIIGLSSDENEARKTYEKIRKTYPDSFLGRLENGEFTRLR